MTLLNSRLMNALRRCSMLKQFRYASFYELCEAECSAHAENTDDIRDNGLDPNAIDDELILNGENGNGTGCVAHAFAYFVSNFVAHGDNGAVSSLKCARKLVLQKKKMKREKRTNTQVL